jgi:dolichol-phosphate mannosyltransferase
MASSPGPLRIKEVSYEFRNRHAGESKMDSQAMWGYLMLLMDKLVGHVLPVRFVAFGLVGAVGVLLHFAVLTALFRVMRLSFTFSQGSATIIAMVSNFTLDNALTFRDMRLKGWRWVKGLASFVLVCSLGAVANVGIASYLFARNRIWVLAALAGIVIGAVWNYAMTATYIWDKQKR